MSTKNPNDWRSQRPTYETAMLARVRDAQPRRDDFHSDTEYRKAFYGWEAKALGLPLELTRKADTRAAKDEEVAFLQPTHQNIEAIEQKLARQVAQRVANGTASLAERRQHSARTGQINHNGSSLDTYRKAYNDMLRVIDEERAGK